MRMQCKDIGDWLISLLPARMTRSYGVDQLVRNAGVMAENKKAPLPVAAALYKAVRFNLNILS